MAGPKPIKRDTPLSMTPPAKVQKWYEKPGSMASKLQKYGTPNKPATKSNSDAVGDMLEAPQKQMTKMVTGKYETPGQALDRKGIVKNKLANDVIDFVVDPINAIGFIKGAQAAKAGTRVPLSKTAKAINRTVRTTKSADTYYDVKTSRGASVLKTGPAGVNLTAKPVVAKDTTTTKSAMPAKKARSQWKTVKQNYR